MRRGRNQQLINVLNKDYLPEELEREIAHLRQDENYSRLINLVIDRSAAVPLERQAEALLQGLDLVEQLMVAANRTAWDTTALERNRGASTVSYVYWRHIDIPLLDAVRRGELAVQLGDALEIAACYVRLPFRVPELDRQILDMLLAADIGEFIASNPPRSDESKVQTAHWKKVVGPAVAAATLCGLALWLASMPETPMMARGLGGLGFAAFALLAALGYAKRRRHRAHEAVQAMQGAYSLLAQQNNAIRELEDHIEMARELGARWSPGLVALLDDIVMRRMAI
jgi:hypothetical protein